MKKVIFENLEITNDGSSLQVKGTFKKNDLASHDDVFACVQGILRGVSKISSYNGEDIRINGNQIDGNIKFI